MRAVEVNPAFVGKPHQDCASWLFDEPECRVRGRNMLGNLSESWHRPGNRNTEKLVRVDLRFGQIYRHWLFFIIRLVRGSRFLSKLSRQRGRRNRYTRIFRQSEAMSVICRSGGLNHGLMKGLYVALEQTLNASMP